MLFLHQYYGMGNARHRKAVRRFDRCSSRSLAVYDGETRSALELLAGCIDTASALEVWGAAMGSTWSKPNVWVHGDLACGNLLVKDGKLHAIIDFGSSAVGDPAYDLVIAWTMLGEEGRHIFRFALALDDATWARGRGWALWKALITLPSWMRVRSGKPDCCYHST